MDTASACSSDAVTASVACFICRQKLNSYDDGLCYTQCQHVCHSACVFEQYNDWGITKCIKCYPAMKAQNVLGHRPVHVNDDALIQTLNMPTSKSRVDLYAEEIANWRDPIVTTNFTASHELAKPLMRLSSKVAGVSEESQKKRSIIAIISDPALKLVENGVTLTDVINLGTVDVHGWMQYRKLEELCDLGATSSHLLMNFQFGRVQWHQEADYSAIKTRMRMTWDEFLTMAYRGDLLMAMKTRIPAQVYALLGMNMRKLCDITGGDIRYLENLNHITLETLVRTMHFDADTFRALGTTAQSRELMHWDAKTIERVFNLELLN